VLACIEAINNFLSETQMRICVKPVDKRLIRDCLGLWEACRTNNILTGLSSLSINSDKNHLFLMVQGK
jgi:hypothetical protein